MKSISARAKYNRKVVDRLFSTADRARDTANKVLAARSSATGRFVAHGLTLSTIKSKSSVIVSDPMPKKKKKRFFAL